MNENLRTALVVDGAAIGTLVASYLTRGSAYGGPELCLVKRFFHVRCAGCGLMRAFASIWEGNFAEAFRMHAMGPFLFAALVLAPCVDAVAVLSRRGPIIPRLLGLRAFQGLVAVGVIAALAMPFHELR